MSIAESKPSNDENKEAPSGSEELIICELLPADGASPFEVALHRNGNGDLPALLIDPVDVHGTVIAGMWLNRGPQEALYHWTRSTPPSRRKRNSEVLDGDATDEGGGAD